MNDDLSQQSRRRSDLRRYPQPTLERAPDINVHMQPGVLSGAPDAAGIRVMVVDDEPMHVLLLSESLKQAGCIVFSAPSAEECLLKQDPQDIDVLITDVVMPGMSGFDLLEKYRAFDRTLSIIVMTGDDGYQSVRTALSMGAYDYIAKPVGGIEELLPTIRRAAAATALERQNIFLLKSMAEMNRKLTILNDRLQILATTDELTELHNRRHIDLQLDLQVELSRAHGVALSVIMLDIDHFKSINDRFTHETGDKVLRLVGNMLARELRLTDIAGRYGGEEFVLLLPDTSPADAAILAERLRSTLKAQALDVGKETLYVTASFGVSGFEAGAWVGGRELICAADEAMYLAKQGGRDRVAVQVAKAAPETKAA